MPFLSQSLTLELLRMERVSDRWYATARAYQPGTQKPYHVRFVVNSDKADAWAEAIATGNSLSLRGQDLPADNQIVAIDLT